MPDIDPATGREPGDSDLTPTYVSVLVVQALVVAGLYWLSRHFV